jgi:hypothetical protein
MALRNLKARHKPVFQEGPDGEQEEIACYAINLSDVTAIVDDHFEEAQTLWSLIDGSAEPGASNRIVFAEIARTAPSLLRRVLMAATRATDPEDIAGLDNVSLIAQWDIVNTSLALTFGRKQWLPGLIEMVRQALGLVTSRRAPPAQASQEPQQSAETLSGWADGSSP